MSPVALVRDLRLHLRAWERHRVRFGVVCSRSRLALCRALYASACTSVPAAELSSLNRIDPGMSLSVLVLDDSLIYRFPYGHQHPRRRGKQNTRFLKDKRLPDALRSVTAPVQAVIFPLSQIYHTEGVTIGRLTERLRTFFGLLPDTLRYAMEIQNSGYLLPEYFDLLSTHGIAHVLSDTAGMPSLLDQIQIPEVMTANHVIVRTTATNTAEWQLGILETVRRCVSEKKELFVYVAENEMVGLEFAMAGLMELLSADLAKLSPLRRRAA